MHPERTGALRVELISVGRELLKGGRRDVNAPMLAEHLTQRGALVHRITIVDDAVRAIAACVREALERQPHLVITTGGLGPASDDRTLEGVAEALGRPLQVSPRARDMVEAAYSRLQARGVVHDAGMTAAREKNFSIPVGAELIANATGIAPGVLLRLAGGAAVLCLPGAPEQMRAVFEAAVPLLKDIMPRRHRAAREVEAPTADESSLRPLLDKLAAEFPAVWIKSHAPGRQTRKSRVIVSLEASGDDAQEAEALVDGAVRRLLALAAGVH